MTEIHRVPKKQLEGDYFLVSDDLTEIDGVQYTTSETKSKLDVISGAQGNQADQGWQGPGEVGSQGPQGNQSVLGIQGPQGLGGLSPDIQVFTTPGSTSWIRPAGARVCTVWAMGGGGGGGGGQRKASGVSSFGGGGGASGGLSIFSFNLEGCPSSLTVTVGAGGAGGPAQTIDDGGATLGSDGLPSAFPGMTNAPGGKASTNGTSGGLAVAGAGYSLYLYNYGRNGGNFRVIGASADQQTPRAGGGGGGGGQITAPGVVYDGCNGGAGGYSPFSVYSGGTGGIVGGALPTKGEDSPAGIYVGGGGGGGGASDASGTAQDGADGGLYGGGGGGGGSSRNGYDSGAGGDGASGFVVVVSS